MSFQAMAWAVDQELPALQKLTLLLLANYAGNEKGECWPSIGTIAKQAGMSRDSVMRAIRELETAGLLTVVRRSVEGVNLPNTYLLNLTASVRGVVAVSNHGVVAHSGGGSRSQRGGVVADSDSNLSVEPVIEPEKPLATRRKRATQPALALQSTNVAAIVAAVASKRCLRTPMPRDDSPVVIDLPCNLTAVTGETVPVCASVADALQRLYPATDVHTELAGAADWLTRRVKDRKTVGGMLLFIIDWLAREQNKPRGNRYAPTDHAQHRSSGRLSAAGQAAAAHEASGLPRSYTLDDILSAE